MRRRRRRMPSPFCLKEEQQEQMGLTAARTLRAETGEGAAVGGEGGEMISSRDVLSEAQRIKEEIDKRHSSRCSLPVRTPVALPPLPA